MLKYKIKTYKWEDLTAVEYHWVKMNESEKLNEYQELARELKKGVACVQLFAFYDISKIVG